MVCATQSPCDRGILEVELEKSPGPAQPKGTVLLKTAFWTASRHTPSGNPAPLTTAFPWSGCAIVMLWALTRPLVVSHIASVVGTRASGDAVRIVMSHPFSDAGLQGMKDVWTLASRQAPHAARAFGRRVRAHALASGRERAHANGPLRRFGVAPDPRILPGG